MADTIREQIISKYITRLASWTTAGGFNISCGSNAQRAVQEVESLPACVLTPQSETNEVDIYGQNRLEMTFKIEAFTDVVSGVNPSITQEKLLGDCIKIMTDRDVVVSSLIDSIVYTDGGPAAANKAEETTVAIYANFKVKYITLVGNPYAQ